MPEYIAISKGIHEKYKWRPTSNFMFAAHDSLCPIVVNEAHIAVLDLPIAFSKSEGSVGLFAVLGLGDEKNYVVDPNGNWLAGYIPAAYRGHPFLLATSENGQKTLCIESDSLNEEIGDDLFENADNPTEKVQSILGFLSEVDGNKQLTANICSLLEELEMLEPWPITINQGGEDFIAEGLFRVKEARFNSLQPSELIKLRDGGAIPLIYCQLLSMQNISRITQLSESASPGKPHLEDLSFDLSENEGTISFDGL